MSALSSVVSDLLDYVRANYPIVWAETHDIRDLQNDLTRACADARWSLVVFDRDYGLRVIPTYGLPEDAATGRQARSTGELAKRAMQVIEEVYANNPIQSDLDFMRAISTTDESRALNNLVKAAYETPTDVPHVTLFVHKNPHFDAIMNHPTVIQAWENITNRSKSAECATNIFTYVPMGPKSNIPSDLKYDVTTVSHPLPDRQELLAITNLLITPLGAEALKEDSPETQAILDAGSGLNRKKFEDAVSLSWVKKQSVCPEVIWDEKRKMITELGFISLYEGNDTFEQMGGLDHYKKFTSALLEGSKRSGIPVRGQLLIGVPGCGKSGSVKCLANETGRYLFRLDLGAARSKWLGETDRNIKLAIDIVESMQPSILTIDEVDKAFSGAGSSSSDTDGGAGDRIFGAFLEWLNDHQSDVFVAFTANNISKLPPEFSRAGRFDGIFFFDLPTPEEREVIWKIHLNKYLGYDPKVLEGALKRLARLVKDSEEWSGAEIEAACRLSALMNVDICSAIHSVVPLSRSSKQEIDLLRERAKGRYLSASKEGIYGTGTSVLDAIKISKSVSKSNRNILEN